MKANNISTTDVTKTDDTTIGKTTNTKMSKQINVLKHYDNDDVKCFEIGVDEVGRGPLFGRVYTAAVILPKDDNNFDFSKIKDSKKFTSKKKIEEVAEYIKNNALCWHISFEDERKIDEINILQATQLSMHTSINEVCKKMNYTFNNLGKQDRKDYYYNLLIDGNYFNPITQFNKITNKIELIPYITIEGGDNKYASIAAASILAKVARDKYIYELCEQYPELITHYSIDTNKGYGTKKHMDGIKEHGISVWHRRTFTPCNNYVNN